MPIVRRYGRADTLARAAQLQGYSQAMAEDAQYANRQAWGDRERAIQQNWWQQQEASRGAEWDRRQGAANQEWDRRQDVGQDQWQQQQEFLLRKRKYLDDQKAQAAAERQRGNLAGAAHGALSRDFKDIAGKSTRELLVKWQQDLTGLLSQLRGLKPGEAPQLVGRVANLSAQIDDLYFNSARAAVSNEDKQLIAQQAAAQQAQAEKAEALQAEQEAKRLANWEAEEKVRRQEVADDIQVELAEVDDQITKQEALEKEHDEALFTLQEGDLSKENAARYKTLYGDREKHRRFAREALHGKGSVIDRTQRTQQETEASLAGDQVVPEGLYAKKRALEAGLRRAKREQGLPMIPPWEQQQAPGAAQPGAAPAQPAPQAAPLDPLAVSPEDAKRADAMFAEPDATAPSSSGGRLFPGAAGQREMERVGATAPVQALRSTLKDLKPPTDRMRRLHEQLGKATSLKAAQKALDLKVKKKFSDEEILYLDTIIPLLGFDE